MRRAFVLLLLLGGCGLDLDNGKLRCADTDPRCPPDYACKLGQCWRGGTGPSPGTNGAGCHDSPDCLSGVCSDGLCCDRVCDGLCESCGVLGSMGSCAPVLDGTASPPGHPSCEGGLTCLAGACGKAPNGVACDSADTCASAICSQGVCCDQACDGCKSCANAGSLGACSPVPQGKDPDLVCALPGSDAECRATCDGAGDCGPAPLVACAPSCEQNSNIASPAAQCPTANQHDLVCSAVTQTCVQSGPGIKLCNVAMSGLSCAPDGQHCATSCSNDLECALGYFCQGTGCVQQFADGDACARDLQCQSTYCDSGQCGSCVVDSDCGGRNPKCASGGCNAGGFVCSAGLCQALGLGSSCFGGQCACNPATLPTDCTSPRAPSCSGGFCGCGAKAPCTRDDVCIQPPTSTSYCAGIAGRPCFGNIACASGSCVGHVCQKAAAGVPCLGAGDCTSGVCAVGAGGITICS